MNIGVLEKFINIASSRKLELLAGLCILGTIIFLHVTNLQYGGSLIRDETNSVKLATRPLAAAIKDDLTYDSFPPFSIVVFHFWSFITASDQGFRILGFLIGLATVAAFWFNSRWMGLGLPFLSWSIFEFNYTAVRYGDYVRAYSLGIFFIILSFSLIWKLTTTPKFNGKLFALACLLAVLSVQTMYQNAFLLLAICLAGIAVAFRHKEWQKIRLIMAVGLFAAVSLLPYVGFIKRANDWMTVSKSVNDPNTMWRVMAAALGVTSPILILIFVALFAAGTLIFYFWRSRNEIPPNRRDLFDFSILALFIGSSIFLVFLQKTKIPAQTYYFIPLLAVAAICIESIFIAVVSNPKLQRVLKVLMALCFLFLTIKINLEFLKTRTTNIDIIAERLPSLTEKNDLILLNPWLIGVSFDRYYKGQTPWLTLPPIDDLSIFRYVVLQKKIAEENPTAPALASVEKTLSSGGRFWLIGLIGSSTREKPTVNYMAPYMYYWSWQLQEFMDRHAEKRKLIDLNIEQEVNSYENFPLIVFQGWKK